MRVPRYGPAARVMGIVLMSFGSALAVLALFHTFSAAGDPLDRVLSIAGTVSPLAFVACLGAILRGYRLRHVCPHCQAA